MDFQNVPYITNDYVVKKQHNVSHTCGTIESVSKETRLNFFEVTALASLLYGPEN